MGSRSKFHKTVRATTPGRALLHGPRPKKQVRHTLTDAFWAVVREKRGADYVPVTAKPPAQPDFGERAANRAEDRRLAARYGVLFADQPRAERRRLGLAKAREERHKLAQVKVETFAKAYAEYQRAAEASS